MNSGTKDFFSIFVTIITLTTRYIPLTRSKGFLRESHRKFKDVEDIFFFKKTGFYSTNIDFPRLLVVVVYGVVFAL